MAGELDGLRELILEMGDIVEGQMPQAAIYAMSFLIGRIIAECAPNDAQRDMAIDNAVATIRATVSGEFMNYPKH